MIKSLNGWKRVSTRNCRTSTKRRKQNTEVEDRIWRQHAKNIIVRTVSWGKSCIRTWHYKHKHWNEVTEYNLISEHTIGLIQRISRMYKDMDLKKESLRFKSHRWSCVDVLGKLLISCCISSTRSNWCLAQQILHYCWKNMRKNAVKCTCYGLFIWIFEKSL